VEPTDIDPNQRSYGIDLVIRGNALANVVNCTFIGYRTVTAANGAKTTAYALHDNSVSANEFNKMASNSLSGLIFRGCDNDLSREPNVDPKTGGMFRDLDGYFYPRQCNRTRPGLIFLADWAKPYPPCKRVNRGDPTKSYWYCASPGMLQVHSVTYNNGPTNITGPCGRYMNPMGDPYFNGETYTGYLPAQSTSAKIDIYVRPGSPQLVAASFTMVWVVEATNVQASIVDDNDYGGERDADSIVCRCGITYIKHVVNGTTTKSKSEIFTTVSYGGSCDNSNCENPFATTPQVYRCRQAFPC